MRPPLRPKLLREAGGKFQKWRAPFASCIAEAQIAGEIDSTFDPTDLAEFLLASLERAILRMKARTRPAALDRLKSIIVQTVFEESKNESPL
jgi:TetR/AcrR family transcriptional repressor of nem operon